MKFVRYKCNQTYDKAKGEIEMKNIRKLVIGTVMAGVLTVGSFTAFAGSEYNSPAELVAGLLGKNVEEVVAEKIEGGKPYGAIASEAGKLEEFRSGMLEIRKDRQGKRGGGRFGQCTGGGRNANNGVCMYQ